MTVKCVHGYGLLRDSCPNCDWESEEPHAAEIVEVVPSWTTRTHKRCRRCAQVASHPVHKKGNR